jgi:hypothetical protein
MFNNPHMPNPDAFIDDECASKGVTRESSFIQREYFGIIGCYDTEAQVFKGRTTYLVPQSVTDLNFTNICVGVDFGFSDYNSVISLAYNKNTRQAWVIRENKFNHSDITTIVNVIKEHDEAAKEALLKKGLDPEVDVFCDNNEKSIIAEDLGYMTDTVRQLVKDTGYPGMKVFQFAFDSRDSSNAADYLPENYPENCVVYTGTHDNDTTAGWMHAILPEELDQAARYIGLDPEHEPVTEEGFVRAFISTAMESRADLCIIPMQDYLELGSEARINIPSTHSGNWEWRLDAAVLKDQDLIRRIRELTVKTGRS